MQHSKPLPTPMIASIVLSTIVGNPFSDPAFYKSIVGGLHYATITRPDLAFSINKVYQFMSSPLDAH